MKLLHGPMPGQKKWRKNLINKYFGMTINFGGDKKAKNYMETFKGWTIALRIYRPTKAYFNGEWTLPKLKMVN